MRPLKELIRNYDLAQEKLSTIMYNLLKIR